MRENPSKPQGVQTTELLESVAPLMTSRSLRRTEEIPGHTHTDTYKTDTLTETEIVSSGGDSIYRMIDRI